MLAPGGVRRIEPDALSGMERARKAAPLPSFGGFWEDEPEGASIDRRDASDDTESLREKSNGSRSRSWAPLEPPDRVVRVSSTPQRPPQTTSFSIAGVAPRDQRRSPWVLFLRVAALTFLLVAAAAFGAGRLNLPISAGGFEAILAAPTPTVSVVGSPPTAPVSALSPDDESALDLGVGGPAAQATNAPAAATAGPTETPTQPGASEGSSSTPAAVTATEPAIPSPTATAPPEPTEAPPAPTPTAVTAAAEDTTPSADAATPNVAVSQPAAVAADEAPAQEIVVGPIRLAIPTALRAESLPRYGLPPGSGDWVLLVVNLANEGDAAASLAMSDFRLFDRGTATVADLDTGTGVIASLAGFDPARSSGDTIALEPGETARALVLFLLPPGSSEDLALLIGQTSLDLAPSLALGQVGPAAEPTLVEAIVTEILDGARIVVDVGGREELVRYLGMQAPAEGACFAAEATAANAELVGGKPVWLEREATDRGPEGALLRDVWVAGADGERALVAARLLEAGAGTAAPAAPDTRYQAWLAAAAALGRSNGAGLWAVCPEPAPASAAFPAAENIAHAFMGGGWYERWGLAIR
jgi:endonuclease YncB( thermonuclease family)